MTITLLGSNLSIAATPPDVFIPGPAGVTVPAGLTTWAISFDTSSCPSNQTCQFIIEWSLDGGVTWVQLPGNGGAGFTGGTWMNKQGQVTGIKQIGPDPVQQSPYPTNFRIHVTQCPLGMSPLNNVNLITT